MASHNPEYSRVRWPDRTRVLGVTLVDALTIDHAILLYRIGSPFMLGGKVGPGTLVTATYVLSRTCKVAARGLQRRRTRWLLRFWGWQVRWLCGPAARALARAAIDQMIDQAFEGPAVWDAQSGGGAKCSAPFLQMIKVRLQAELHASREAALAYPVREALWDLACEGEFHNRVEWVSAEEAEQIEAAAKN